MLFLGCLLDSRTWKYLPIGCLRRLCPRANVLVLFSCCVCQFLPKPMLPCSFLSHISIRIGYSPILQKVFGRIGKIEHSPFYVGRLKNASDTAQKYPYIPPEFALWVPPIQYRRMYEKSRRKHSRNILCSIHSSRHGESCSRRIHLIVSHLQSRVFLGREYAYIQGNVLRRGTSPQSRRNGKFAMKPYMYSTYGIETPYICCYCRYCVPISKRSHL